MTQGGATADPVYDVVAAFVGQLVRAGVSDVVISPGSRSTPLTLSFHSHPDLRSWIQLDERAAAFFALGLGRACGRPAVLVCTSGTAAANYLPAVVEASHAGVPLVVCTADRPPELRGWGSPQTIDQVGLYGPAVRWAIDLPVPSDTEPQTARHWADQAVAAATGPHPGPVHLNWPLQEPLEPVAAVPIDAGTVAAVPIDDERSRRGVDAGRAVARVGEIVASHERGVIVVGPWPGVGFDVERAWSDQVLELGARAGWPVIGEPLSHVRGDGRGARVVATADHVVGSDELGDRLRADVALLFGGPPTTKPVRRWLERTQPEHVILFDLGDRAGDAVVRLTERLDASPELLADVVGPSTNGRWQRSTEWLDVWDRVDGAARDALDIGVSAGPPLSAMVARALVAALPADSVLVASNSMPVRDLDAFVVDSGRVVCIGNRGASGIDGIVSTALGIAAADRRRPVTVYIGDLALLHDLVALTAARRLGLHLTVVCVDNNGGEIFSLLPIAGRIDPHAFEALFRTPHDLDLSELDGFGGVRVHGVGSDDELISTVQGPARQRQPGVDLLIVDIDRDADVRQRRALSAVAAAAARNALHAELGA